MNELYFTAMDIAEETRQIIESSYETVTNNMTENELKAYHLGVRNTIGAMKAAMTTEGENELILNIEHMEVPTEFDFDDLETYIIG